MFFLLLCYSEKDMYYYALQVKTGKEVQFLERFHKDAIFSGIKDTHVYFPRRTLYIRKKGIRKKSVAAVFPGYVFLETEELSNDVYWFLRKIPGFYRFLPNSSTPRPLIERDIELLRHFLKFGEITVPSKAYFDENDRICILEGPLKGLEGKIIKVDKRKGRAKILLDMYSETFPIDLAFEIIQRTTSPQNEVENT